MAKKEKASDWIDLDALAIRIALAWSKARTASIIDDQFAGREAGIAVMRAPRRGEILAIKAELEATLGPSRAGSSIPFPK